MSVTTTDERKILILFDKRDCISLKAAANIAGKSESTCELGARSTGSAAGSGAGRGQSVRLPWRCSSMGTGRRYKPITPETGPAKR